MESAVPGATAQEIRISNIGPGPALNVSIVADTDRLFTIGTIAATESASMATPTTQSHEFALVTRYRSVYNQEIETTSLFVLSDGLWSFTSERIRVIRRSWLVNMIFEDDDTTLTGG